MFQLWQRSRYFLELSDVSETLYVLQGFGSETGRRVLKRYIAARDLETTINRLNSGHDPLRDYQEDK